MLTLSLASLAWPGTAQGQTAGYGTCWTQKISSSLLTLLLPIQEIFTLPHYPAPPHSHLLIRPSPGWTVPLPLSRPIREQVLQWTSVTSGIKHLYVIFWEGSALCLTGHFFPQSQSCGPGSGQRGGQYWAKVPTFPAVVRCWEKWRQKGSIPSLPWPHLHSQPICVLSMWTFRKSKTASQALTYFQQHFRIFHRSHVFLFFPSFLVQALADQGIRLRSYSYSSSKISLRPARLARDNHSSDVSPGP